MTVYILHNFSNVLSDWYFCFWRKEFSTCTIVCVLHIYRRLDSHLYGPMSQVLHSTCPKVSNFQNVGRVKSYIQAVRYQIVPHSKWLIYFFTCTRTHLSAIPAELVFWYLQIFSCVYYDWILSIGKHVNFTDLGVSLWLSAFCMIFPTFLQTGISAFDGRSFQLVRSCVCVLRRSKI